MFSLSRWLGETLAASKAGNLRFKTCFSGFLRWLFPVCSQRFSDEVLKSQPSDKTAGNIYSVPFLPQLGSGFKNTLAQALKIRSNSNHTTLTRRNISNNFPADDSEGAYSLASPTLVRPDVVFPPMLQTPAVLPLMSPSPLGFQKAAFTYHTRHFFK